MNGRGFIDSRYEAFGRARATAHLGLGQASRDWQIPIPQEKMPSSAATEDESQHFEDAVEYDDDVTSPAPDHVATPAVNAFQAWDAMSANLVDNLVGRQEPNVIPDFEEHVQRDDSNEDYNVNLSDVNDDDNRMGTSPISSIVFADMMSHDVSSMTSGDVKPEPATSTPATRAPATKPAPSNPHSLLNSHYQPRAQLKRDEDYVTWASRTQHPFSFSAVLICPLDGHIFGSTMVGPDFTRHHDNLIAFSNKRDARTSAAAAACAFLKEHRATRIENTEALNDLPQWVREKIETKRASRSQARVGSNQFW